MKFGDLLTMSLNNLRRRKLRTALTVLGVIIGTASIVVMVSLGIGLNELNRELISSYGSLTAIEVFSENYGGGGAEEDESLYLTEDTIAQMKQIEHVKSVYPKLEIQTMMIQGKYKAGMTLTGVPLEYMREINLAQGQVPSHGDKSLQLIYGNSVIQWFSDGKSGSQYWETGELPDVDFMGKPMFVIFDVETYYSSMSGGEDAPKMPKKYMIPAAGVVEGEVNEYNDHAYSVYARLDLLEAQLKRVFKKKPIPGQPTNKKGKPYPYFIYSGCIVNVDEMEYVTEVQKQLTDMGFQASSRADWMEQSEKQSGMIQAVLGGIGAVSLFVAAIGIANTMMMSIYERTKEIGVMKVLGCDMAAIRNMFLAEAGFIGLIGGVAGIVLSYMISAIINFVLRDSYYSNVSYIPPYLTLLALIFAVVIGMVAGLFPALRAMRLSPLAAIRNE